MHGMVIKGSLLCTASCTLLTRSNPVKVQKGTCTFIPMLVIERLAIPTVSMYISASFAMTNERQK